MRLEIRSWASDTADNELNRYSQGKGGTPQPRLLATARAPPCTALPAVKIHREKTTAGTLTNDDGVKLDERCVGAAVILRVDGPTGTAVTTH